MKKLNSKGFTLVELLAVIVILAIVVGITMVTIIPTLSSNRESAFETAVETIQVYLQEEYDNCLIGDTSIASYVVFETPTQTEKQKEDNVTPAACSGVKSAYSENSYKEILAKTGYTGDISILSVTVLTSGRVEVQAYPTATGKYKSVARYNGSASSSGSGENTTYTYNNVYTAS